jgi:hypothetical protein
VSTPNLHANPSPEAAFTGRFLALHHK